MNRKNMETLLLQMGAPLGGSVSGHLHHVADLTRALGRNPAWIGMAAGVAAAALPWCERAVPIPCTNTYQLLLVGCIGIMAASAAVLFKQARRE